LPCNGMLRRRVCSPGGGIVRLLKLISLAALVMCATSLAFADGVDPLVSAQRGPTGSPTCASGPITSIDCTVAGGQTLTAVTITLPVASGLLVCEASNAFLDPVPGSSLTVVGGIAEFASTVSGGIQTCSWAASTVLPPYPQTTDVQILAAENACLAENLGPPPAIDGACGGIPGGTDYSDLDYVAPGTDTTGLSSNLTLVPEPNSFAMLLVGLAGVFLYRRRRLA
jgi:hypothetical protein